MNDLPQQLWCFYPKYIEQLYVEDDHTLGSEAIGNEEEEEEDERGEVILG